MSHIGAKIRALRTEKGTTLPKLALRAGISKGLLSTIETDRLSNPSLSTLHKIAEALHTTIAKLIDGEQAVLQKAAEVKPEWHDKLVALMKSKNLSPDPAILEAILAVQNRKALKSDDLAYWQSVYDGVEKSFKM